MASPTNPTTSPQYATAHPVSPLSPQPSESQFSTFSGYGLPGVTVAPPIQPTPILPSFQQVGIQQPAPTAIRNCSQPYDVQSQVALGAGPVSPVVIQPVPSGQMAYEERDPDAERRENKANQKQRCLDYGMVCGELTCVSILLTFAATLAACEVAICCMDCMASMS
jgi:hypothetical protein